MTWEFRIIEGLQEGCHYSLEEGISYKVGPSYNCDILVLDQSEQSDSEAPYFEFIIQNGTVILSQINKMIQNHKDQIIHEGSTLNLPALLSFLNVKAAICDPKDTNETLLKTLHDEGKTDATEHKTDPTQEEQETDPRIDPEHEDLIKDLKLFDDSRQDKKETFVSKHLAQLKDFVQRTLKKARAQAEELKSQEKLKMKKEFIKKYKHIITLIAVILVLCVVAFIAVGIFSSGSSNTNASSQSNGGQTALGIQVQGIKQILLNLPPSFSNVKVMPSKEGKLVIEGLVVKSTDVDLLKSKLKSYNSILSYQVSTVDQATTGIKQILKTKGLSMLDVAYDNTYAQMTLSGIVSDMNVINDLELAISSQYPEVGSIDTNRIYASSDIETDFDKILNENNFKNQLHVTKNLINRNIKIEGFLSKNDIQTLKDNMDKFAKKYNNIVAIDVEVKDIMYALPFKISIVYTGDNPMFITTDGRKVFQGGTIGGMLVEKITQNEIVFSGDYPLVYNLNSPFADDVDANADTKTTNANADKPQNSSDDKSTEDKNSSTSDLGL